MKLYIIDAFSDVIFGGNPAGVAVIAANEDFPADDVMQKIAHELRYSETVFAKQRSKNQLDVRYFTPASEVNCCGHATVALFIALKDLKLVSNDTAYLCNTKAGQISVSVADKNISMQMGKPQIISTIEDIISVQEIYSVMGLEYSEVYYNSQKLFPQIVLTGLADIILPISNLNALNSINPNFKALAELSKRYNVVGVHAFTISADFPKITAHCRNFAPLYDIDEESATGTSNGSLSFYLYDKRIISKNVPLMYIQGEKMERPSKILSEIKEIDGEVVVFIGGNGVILVKGGLSNI